MKRLFHKQKSIFTVTVIVAVLSLVLGAVYIRGFWDESRAVHIKADNIESSTLAIGTHLIHISALTDSIYDIAGQSAEESGQSEIYYKSELGEDAWFNITSATSLVDITTGGSPVTDEEIEELFFTHHTKSDKVTYDLRTGEAVNIFNIRDPYDLKTLDEMLPLKMQYDQIINTTGEDDVTKRIDEIWKTDVKNPPDDSDGDDLEKASVYDEYMSALEAYISYLRDRDADADEIEVANQVMSSVDAARRYLVFANLLPVMEDYIIEIGGSAPPPPEESEGEEGEEGETEEEEAAGGTEPQSAELISATAETIGNIQGAMITYGGLMLAEGMTVISSAEYEFSNSLISNAKLKNYTACDNAVKNLIHLDKIQNDVISDRVGELTVLDDTLIPDAISEYRKILGQGESAEYRAEKTKNSPQALLDRFEDEYANNTNTKRGELEFLVEAKTKRMEQSSAMDYIDDVLAMVSDEFVSDIQYSDFADSAQNSLRQFIGNLSALKREIEQSSGGNELDKLLEEKSRLQEKRMAALDENDLATAKAIENEINAIEEEIRAKENEIGAKIAQLQDEIRGLEDGSSQKLSKMAELEALQNSLSDGTLGSLVADMKKNGDADGLMGLLSSAPELVLPALQEIYNDLLLNDGDTATIDAIEQAILNNPTALRDELSAAQIKKLIDDWLDKNGGDGTEGIGSGAGTGSGGISGSGAGTGSGSDAGSGSGSSSGSGAGSGSGSGAGSDSGGGAGTGSGNGLGSGLGIGLGSGAGNGLGIGSGSNSGRDSADDADESLLGIGGLSNDATQNAAAVIIGLELYASETGSNAAKQVASAKAQMQVDLGNPLLYSAINDGSGEYVSLISIQALTGRRYVWNKNASLGVLAYGSDYYGFTVYSEKVLRDRDGEKTEKMPRAAVFRNGVHIPEEYASEAFEVECVYLSSTNMACIYNVKIAELAQEIFTMLIEA